MGSLPHDSLLAWENGANRRPDAGRKEWETPLRCFSQLSGHDWDEVSGDRDLACAADEEKETPDIPTAAR